LETFEESSSDFVDVRLLHWAVSNGGGGHNARDRSEISDPNSKLQHPECVAESITHHMRCLAILVLFLSFCFAYPFLCLRFMLDLSFRISLQFSFVYVVVCALLRPHVLLETVP